MKQAIVYLVAASLMVSPMSAAQPQSEQPDAPTDAVLLTDVPVEYLGGVPGIETKNGIDGKLEVTTSTIRFTSKDDAFDIPVEQVTFLSGGEFAKRRVKGALVGAILLSPVFLFALIGKKKRDILVIEYSDTEQTAEDGTEPKLTGAAMLRYKPKGGRAIAIENAVSRVTGLDIAKEDLKEGSNAEDDTLPAKEEERKGEEERNG